MAPPRKSSRVASAAATAKLTAVAAPEATKKKKKAVPFHESAVKKASGRGKPKKEKVVVKEVAEGNASDDGSAVENQNAEKTVVVEYCKQCQQFKIRAFKVKDALEKAFPSINVQLNPEQPRRGCFEVREEIGEIFISLLDMKRPFTKMKALDMDEVVADIVKKIGEA